MLPKYITKSANITTFKTLLNAWCGKGTGAAAATMF